MGIVFDSPSDVIQFILTVALIASVVGVIGMGCMQLDSWARRKIGVSRAIAERIRNGDGMNPGSDGIGHGELVAEVRELRRIIDTKLSTISENTRVRNHQRGNG